MNVLPRSGPGGSRLAVLLPFVLVSFAANSLITRHVVNAHLLDAGVLSAVRFVAGALALVGLALARRERLTVGRPNLLPALWLGTYAACISYGYGYIGAAPGTFVFYATVLVTLMAHDLVTGSAVPARRVLGAAVSLVGVGVLAEGSIGTVTPLGVVLLAATGVAWGLYTAAGRTTGDPRVATTGHFVVLSLVAVPPATAGLAAGLRFTVTGLCWAIVMGAGTTAFAYVAWYACQRSMSGTAAGSVQLVIPVLTTAGAVLLLGERLSAALLVAAVLVGAGMWLGRPRDTSPQRSIPSGPDRAGRAAR
jgi:drug/metabolite transporter (DMT)-like permease